MEITLQRKTKTDKSTIGIFKYDDKTCYSLEDVDRGLDQGQLLAHIKRIKVFGQTAIPTGRYRVILSYSNRFQKYLPELLNVPGFEGIRVHAGNTPESSNGCLLLGSTKGNNFVGNSVKTFEEFFFVLRQKNEIEKNFITIT